MYLRFFPIHSWNTLTLSWRGRYHYRNQSIDLQSKSINWFLYENGPRHEWVKLIQMGMCVTQLLCTNIWLEVFSERYMLQYVLHTCYIFFTDTLVIGSCYIALNYCLGTGYVYLGYIIVLSSVFRSNLNLNMKS